VDEAIEAVCRDYRIDRSRIVLRGSSLGAWDVAARLEATGPICGPRSGRGTGGHLRVRQLAVETFRGLDPLTPWQKTMLHMVDPSTTPPMPPWSPWSRSWETGSYFESHLLIEKAFAKESIPFVGLVDRGAGHGVTAKVMQEQLNLLGSTPPRAATRFQTRPFRNVDSQVQPLRVARGART